MAADKGAAAAVVKKTSKKSNNDNKGKKTAKKKSREWRQGVCVYGKDLLNSVDRHGGKVCESVLKCLVKAKANRVIS